jgi:hypothetical protein
MSEQIFKAKERGVSTAVTGWSWKEKPETAMSRPKGKKWRLANKKDLKRLAKLQRRAQRRANKRKAKINDSFWLLRNGARQVSSTHDSRAALRVLWTDA